MNDEPNAEGAPRPPRHPLLRRFLAARIGASLVLGCFGCAVAVWFLALSLRHQPVRPAGWYVPPALVAVFAVLAGHVLRKVRAWLGPGVDVAWTPEQPVLDGNVYSQENQALPYVLWRKEKIFRDGFDAWRKDAGEEKGAKLEKIDAASLIPKNDAVLDGLTK